MSDASIIGMGAMGSALARALLAAGHSVTVWNRTETKCAPLVQVGAQAASSVTAAVTASPTIIVCVLDYAATDSLLHPEQEALRGRLLIQLSTGTPQQAGDTAAWAGAHGIEYLDGAIMCFPDQIATPEAAILVAGAESAFRKAEPLLRILGGGVTYVGDRAGAASSLDCAILSYALGALLGAIHGARICEAEGLPVDELGEMFASLSPIVAGEAKHIGAAIHANHYENPKASLDTWAAVALRLVQQAGEGRIDGNFPGFASRMLQRGVAAGYGAEEIAAMIKVLRTGN
jgi:3-hydroxyisobutyrate dehydrogenase-like beta-hydroxyacid dehydrogenase